MREGVAVEDFSCVLSMVINKSFLVDVDKNLPPGGGNLEQLTL